MISGGAAGLCLELSNPNRTRASELAAAIVSNLSAIAPSAPDARLRDGKVADAARTGKSFKSNAALLLSSDGASAAELASQSAWPPQLHAQIERALRLYDRELAARKRALEAQFSEAWDLVGRPRDRDGCFAGWELVSGETPLGPHFFVGDYGLKRGDVLHAVVRRRG